MSSSARDAIRTKVFDERATNTVVELDNGLTIEVREGTVGAMLDAVAEPDLKKRMATMLILSCFVPETNEKVFEEADFDSLMNLPSGGTYQKLMDAVNSRIRLGDRVTAEGKG